MMSSELCLYPFHHLSPLPVYSVLCYPWSVVLVPCHHYHIILEFMTLTTSRLICKSFGSES